MASVKIIAAHAGSGSLSDSITSWTHDAIVVDGRNGMLIAYERGWRENYADIYCFFHDDFQIQEIGWQQRILKEFEDPTVGLIGMGGALGHGDHNLYKVPYSYQQLARSNFMSNMVDAENHGKRFTGSCDVAVLDGFALIVRRELLEKTGGWPLNTPIGYVCYDYWLCCMVRRLGYRIRLVGIPCAHLGGQTFVKLGIGKDPKHWQQYVDSHRYIYDEFADVLPYEVP